MARRPYIRAECWGHGGHFPSDVVRPSLYIGFNPAHDRASAALKTSPNDPYWALRFCETQHEDTLSITRGRPLYARSVACVLSYDPQFAIERSYVGLAFALRLDGRHARTVKSAERHLRIDAPETRHHVAGKIWAASMHGGLPPHLPIHGRRAVDHLRKVADAEQNAEWMEAICVAASWGDYAFMREAYGRYFGLATSDERLRQAYRVVLSAAFRNADWPTYDEVRGWYAEWYERAGSIKGTREDEATLLVLDGLRAYAGGRMRKVREALRRAASDFADRWGETGGLLVVLARDGALLDDCRRCVRAQIKVGRRRDSLVPELRALLKRR